MRNSVLLFVACVFIGGALSAEIFNCKNSGESCRGFPKCCGSLVCRADGKWNPFVGGTCRGCGNDGDRCVKNDQCCPPLKCDKQKVGHVNGYCRPTRPRGAKCHEDSQCDNDCKKVWYKIYGTCA